MPPSSPHPSNAARARADQGGTGQGQARRDISGRAAERRKEGGEERKRGLIGERRNVEVEKSGMKRIEERAKVGEGGREWKAVEGVMTGG